MKAKYRITLLLEVDESTDGPLLNRQIKTMLLEAIHAEPRLYVNDAIQIEPEFEP